MEVPGIVDALIYVLNEGVVTVFPVAEGSGLDRTPSGSVNPNPYPAWENGQFTELTGEGQFLQIANSIEGSEAGSHDRRPAMASVKLEKPNYTGFSIEIDGLTSRDYDDVIKDVLISILDSKRPHLVVLGYSEANGKINRISLASSITEVINGETYTSIIMRNDNGESITEATLGIGCLSYLKQLKINGSIVFDVEPAEVEE